LILGAAASGLATESIYERAMRSALDRTRTDLERTTDLWVDHSRWENAWQVRHGHYLVRTTQSYQYGLEIAQALEEMYGYFTKILKPGFETGTPFPIYILPNIPAYNQFGEDHGAHHSSIYGSFFAAEHEAQPVALVYDESTALVLMQATHSALHQFMARAFTRPPPDSLSEGLASYFSFRWGYAWAVDQLEGLIETDRFLPLRQVMNSTIDQYGGNTHAHFIELGMLVYYLAHFREDTRMTEEGDGSFVNYVRAVLEGRDVTGFPVHQLLNQRIDELETDFKAFKFPK
jgi:hypothetical protein